MATPPDTHENDLIRRLPRHLKMDELRVFAAVMDYRSSRKAAAVLHLTQPAVTKVIAGLEDTLGVRLFNRLTHGVEPTLHAVSFAPRAAAIFDELRRAAQDLVQVSSGARGTLRVGTVPISATPLPAALQRLTAALPDASISLVEARESNLIERLRKRDIELAILRVNPRDLDDDLHGELLFEEELCVLAGSKHPLAARNALAWHELLCERWVLPPPDGHFFAHVRNTLERAGLAMPRRTVESFSVSVHYVMVLRGGMLCFGMSSPFDFPPGNEGAVRLPFELPALVREVSAVSLGAHELSPLAQMLMDQLRTLAAPFAASKPPARGAAGRPRSPG